MKRKLTFEEGIAELEELVKGLETGEMPLEDSFKAYERAVAIRDSLNKLLDESDARIRVLTETGEQPLPGEADA